MGQYKTPKIADRGVEEAIQALVVRLRRAYRIDRILLFGSRARGDSLKSSDVDLVIVSPDFAGVGWVQRITAVAKLWRGPVTLEALCYTPEEFERRAGEISIVRVAGREGIRIV